MEGSVRTRCCWGIGAAQRSCLMRMFLWHQTHSKAATSTRRSTYGPCPRACPPTAGAWCTRSRPRQTCRTSPLANALAGACTLLRNGGASPTHSSLKGSLWRRFKSSLTCDVTLPLMGQMTPPGAVASRIRLYTRSGAPCACALTENARTLSSPWTSCASAALLFEPPSIACLLRACVCACVCARRVLLRSECRGHPAFQTGCPP
mmetsp:Transcript_44571/g.139674  ORF Transcript_44571/g.139674 Transcript_44571/m.139674 type:complete len:205 (+) Transcript_44571:40-654(+)